MRFISSSFCDAALCQGDACYLSNNIKFLIEKDCTAFVGKIQQGVLAKKEKEKGWADKVFLETII